MQDSNLIYVMLALVTTVDDMSLPPWSAAVLAGGVSSRFGEDKARYIYQGRPLMQHVLDSLSQADEQMIVANRAYEEFVLPVHPDMIQGAGSLSGLHAALSYAKHPWLALAACDLAFLTEDFWQCLLAQRSDASIVIAENSEGRLEPLAALYHKRLLPTIEKQIEQKSFAMKSLSKERQTKIIKWHHLQHHVGENIFLNANYLTDLP